MAKLIALIGLTLFGLAYSYSAVIDEQIIAEFKNSKPKPPKDHAKVARHLVHKSNWAATGTISTDENMKGFPMVNIISIADSATEAPSTGNIYFLLTTLDFTGQDIKKDNKITFMISDDEDLSCAKNNNTDPMEPTCARVILAGKVIELQPQTKEYGFAEYSFVSRHPAAANWAKAHTFFLCKLSIETIYVLDWYGGPHNVDVDDYFNATLDKPIEIMEISNEIPSIQLNTKKGVHIKINKEKHKSITININ